MAVHFTDSFKAWVVDVIDGATRAGKTDMKFGAWGTGAGTTGETDTTLFTEASETRVTGTMSQQTTTITGDTYRLVWTMTADGTKTVTNAGYFDASTSGNLGIKGDHAGVPVLLNDSIEYTANLHVDQ